MPDYRLKAGQERFVVVDGPFENRQYEPGLVYAEIPPGEEHRFDEVMAEPPATGKKTKPEPVQTAGKAEEAEQ